MVVRVEDTDAARSTRESEAAVLRDLAWLGITYDEGPDVGGENGPYRQSERRHIYDAKIQARAPCSSRLSRPCPPLGQAATMLTQAIAPHVHSHVPNRPSLAAKAAAETHEMLTSFAAPLACA